MQQEGRILHDNWDLYDTRHCVYRPTHMATDVLESGYWRSYQRFYRWGSIFRGAWAKEQWQERLRHVAFAAGWKKCEPLWDFIIRIKRVTNMLPLLETILEDFGSHPSEQKHEAVRVPVHTNRRAFGSAGLPATVDLPSSFLHD